MTGPTPSTEQTGFSLPLIQQIQEHQAEYLVTYNDPEKKRLREEIAELKEQIQGWQENPEGFIWQVEFPEVFQKGGFDIVIGNPPYVRHHNIHHIKPILKSQFDEFFTGMADLYVYFYKRGTELLRTNGILTYISSNKFMRGSYGIKLRMFLTSKVSIHILIDFADVPVFKASVDTCIVLLEKDVKRCTKEMIISAATFRERRDILHLSEAFQDKKITVCVSDLAPVGWALALPKVYRLLKKLEKTGTPLGSYTKDGLYIGIITGCNDAFIIDESIRQRLISNDARNGKLIRPMLRGRDLRKWQAMSVKDYLITIPSSTDKEWPWSSAKNELEAEQIFEETYPAIYQHVKGYHERRIQGTNKGKYYWEFRSCAYYSEFDKPKIIYRRIAQSLDAVFDTLGTVGLNTTFFMPTDDLSLLAILNSKLFDWFARHKFQSLNDPWTGGGLEFSTQYMKKVPIADRTEAQKAALSELVERILEDPNSDQVREIEQEIDALVYELYGLTDDEIELIKQTYRDAGMDV